MENQSQQQAEPDQIQSSSLARQIEESEFWNWFIFSKFLILLIINKHKMSNILYFILISLAPEVRKTTPHPCAFHLNFPCVSSTDCATWSDKLGRRIRHLHAIVGVTSQVREKREGGGKFGKSGKFWKSARNPPRSIFWNQSWAEKKPDLVADSGS